MKGDCKGKCGSLLFLRHKEGRETRTPIYHYERYCHQCEIAYKRPRQICPCCKRVLRDKPRNPPKKIKLMAQQGDQH